MIDLPQEPDYASMTPNAMEAATREHVIEGFRRLNHTPSLSPDLSDVMGVIVADAQSLLIAEVVPKGAALAFAKEADVGLPLMLRCAAENKSDALGILILTPQGEGFVELPVKFIQVSLKEAGQA